MIDQLDAERIKSITRYELYTKTFMSNYNV